MNFFEQKNSFREEDLGFLQVLKLGTDLIRATRINSAR